MIKLFKETDTVYKTNGEVVINATKCRVSNGDGGEFKLTLTCPISYSEYIENNYIIVAPTPAGEQPFRVYEIEKSQNKMDIKARHITYDSMDYVIPDSYAVDKTCGEAMEHFNDATDNPSPFSVYSDIEDINTLRIVRKSLYDAINEVNERWGGHIVRDMFSISNLAQIGRDNGITIEYRKNLQSITATYDFSGVCTKLLPVGRDGTLLDTLYVYSPVQYDIPHTKVVDFEQDIEKDDYPSEEAYIAALKADLLEQAIGYVNTYCYPSVNYTLKGKPEKVTDIGDVIKVKDERLGIDILTQVISYEFDCITETYKSLEFGNFTNSLSNLMSNISTNTNETVNKAIQNLPQPNEATEEKSGLMSASDKTKLDGIEAGAQKNVQADWNEQNPLSDAYIKNKPEHFDQIQADWNETDNTQPDYIKNKPTIPAAQVNADWNATSGVAEILHKPSSMPASDVYPWAKAQNKPSYSASEVGAIPTTMLGSPDGVAELDSNGLVPTSQLPSSIDNVVTGTAQNVTTQATGTYAATGFIKTGESTPTTLEENKIYLDTTINVQFRWTGESTNLISIGSGLTLGETSTTAYRGDRGKTAYDHSQLTSGNPHNVSKTDVGLGNVPNVTTDNQTPTVTEASARTNLATGDTLKTIIGKIKKYFSDLASVAFSGSYNDLSNKPTIPAAQVNSDWNATSGVAKILNKPSLAAVATSGAYSDLSGTPTIPTVNNSTITIKKNGTTVDSFTLNQSTGKNIDISVPTKTSDLTNDSGYVTTDEKVTAEAVSPTSETSYYMSFVTNTGNQKPKLDWSFRIFLKKGTTSSNGYNYLQLGNNKATGAEDNQYGCLRIFSKGSGRVDLYAPETTNTNRDIRLPDQSGTIALTKDLTTYAFAQGTNNGEIKITPSVGGTAGTAVTVKPKGISDLAYIAKGSGSSKFLREDGTWQTVTVTWNGGSVSNAVTINSTLDVTGTSSMAFIEPYAVPSSVVTYVGTNTNPYKQAFIREIYLGTTSTTNGHINFRQNLSSYTANLYAPSTTLSGNINIHLPDAAGTLATQEWVKAPTVVSSQRKLLTTNCYITFKKWSNGMKSIHCQAPNVAASVAIVANFIPADYKPTCIDANEMYIRATGYNNNITSNPQQAFRACAFNATDFWLYVSNAQGFYLTFFYT